MRRVYKARVQPYAWSLELRIFRLPQARQGLTLSSVRTGERSAWKERFKALYNLALGDRRLCLCGHEGALRIFNFRAAGKPGKLVWCWRCFRGAAKYNGKMYGN